MANKKSKETVYRSPNGERWRLTPVAKYNNALMAVRINDGYVLWNTDNLHQLIEESEWLKSNNPALKKKRKK